MSWHTPLLPITDPFAQHQSHLNQEKCYVGCPDFRFQLGRQQDSIGWRAREEEQEDALDERDEGDIEYEPHNSRYF